MVLVPGTNTVFPDAKIGTSAAPDEIANVYDGAWMVWEYALKEAASVYQDFTNVSIRGIGSGTNCSTTTPNLFSCAFWDLKNVFLGDDAAFAPQSRVMHELSHVATGQAHEPGFVGVRNNYCWPNASPACAPVWDSFSSEWGGTQFEEAMAQHSANAALYERNSLDPRTCFGDSMPCTSLMDNVENSLGASCTESVQRRPIQAMKYLWDRYDYITNTDPNFPEPNDTIFISEPHGDTLQAINNFPISENNGGANEDANSVNLSNRYDARSTIDHNSNAPMDRQTLLDNLNCGGVGD